MKRILILLACALLALPALADLVAGTADNYVRLTHAPCTDEAILAHIPAEAQSQFHAGVVRKGKDSIALCWMPFEDIIVLFGAKGGVYAPASEFQFQPGV